ncbi:outer membrane beta-barrel protein [Dyadobacter sp. CY261]|uniref:outer membrane beta-barrel protein n=1 Tax=Dyadobacter sp. CY261 TaxID=2907203 RepID=UPI001F44DC59|nr:outer membrane beta-barrel protein [Dyadobacter sp. CY261]MCF0071031.1 outer membrane beta-barrel protein [Dyadobacter sp. CY261]
MKTILATHVLAAMLFSAPAFSQVAPNDSLQALNGQKKAIEISKDINERKIELIEKQQELDKQRAQMQENAATAQASADANTSAARDLAANPQDKKLSRKASSAAKNAQRDAKNARKVSDSVDKLNEEVLNLQKEIQEKEQELASNTGMSTPAPQAPVAANAGSSQTGSAVQGSSATAPNPNTPYVVQRDVTSDANAASATAVAQRALEATYKNYPQQPGQPTIIINNIIVPADYNGQQSRAVQPVKEEVTNQDQADYEDYKAWLRHKKGQSASSDAASYAAIPNRNEAESSEPSDKSDRLDFRQRFGEKPQRNSGMWVIPMVGIHASNFNADFQDDQYEGRAGWNAGLDFRFRMRKFFIQPGVHYFSSSLNVTSEDSISTAPLLTGPRIHSLKAPLMIGVYLTRAKGGFFRFNIKGGVVGTYVINVDQNGSDRFDKDNIEDFSYGLNAGFGLEFGFVTLDFSHEWGMSRLFKESNQKNNILRATLGFKL